MAKRRSLKDEGACQFREIAVGGYFFMNSTRDINRVYRKAGRASAITPDGGTCKMTGTMWVFALNERELLMHKSM